MIWTVWTDQEGTGGNVVFVHRQCRGRVSSICLCAAELSSYNHLIID